MRRARLLPLITTLFAILVLATAAPVLDSTAISSPYDVSVNTDAGASGLSFMAIMLLFVSAFVEFVFGVELEQIGLGGASGVSGGLLPFVVPLLVVGFVIGAFYLASRRFAYSPTGAVLSHLLDQPQSEGSTSRPSTSETWPPAEPDPGVAEAWAKMTASVDLERPTARTPMEWAEEAIDDGLDADAVDDLTSTFRDVQYGENAETPEHRRRANRALDQLEDDIE
ncbi:hypothetical protein HALLA_20970 (plasmid) [Halostagnicola larsenii XH-48]|uniref:Protein-glutamine gamma-glutamyltransferase-like C-terminal domain-containing protein n=1 Tax=Halostagnicola larsenii XH-48 TaxID=797299 RepID=W0JV15_9EURY|nr:DUF4129 domain-containing protein [Halostagnicola larsenii]AHG02379.1 hypothetical protein HALLA_20970 [Halostagnicola larsenii XH-48]